MSAELPGTWVFMTLWRLISLAQAFQPLLLIGMDSPPTPSPLAPPTRVADYSQVRCSLLISTLSDVRDPEQEGLNLPSLLYLVFKVFTIKGYTVRPQAGWGVEY